MVHSSLSLIQTPIQPIILSSLDRCPLVRGRITGYSGPSLNLIKGHSLERTPLYKGHIFLAASTMNVCNAPSHQRTPLS